METLNSQGQNHLMPTFLLLGAARLVDDHGFTCAVPYDKVQALAIWLAMEPDAHTRTQLAQWLWPASSADQALANLRRALHDLRRVLHTLPEAAADDLCADRKSVRLRADEPRWRVDVRTFMRQLLPLLSPAMRPDAAQLQQALALYGGPFLHGFHLDDTPAFADWAARRRGQLERLAAHGLQRWADQLEAEGQPEAALAPLDRLLAIDPWAEPVQRQRLRLLALSSPASALRAFEQFEAELQKELGISPQPETLALADSLRRHGGRSAQAPGNSRMRLADPAADGVTARPARFPPLERRRLWVLACDLEPADASQPSLDTRLPGEAAQVLKAGADLLLAHGAQLHQAEDGELLACFGHWPAHENALQLALRAGRALRQSIPDALHCRLGLHLGWALLSPGQPGLDAWGPLRKQARRLALAAEPGQLVVSDAVAQADGGLHRFSPAVQGFVVHELAAPAHGAPLVGRTSLHWGLLAEWALAAGRGPRAVLLYGEAGIGKSRLLAEMASAVRQQQRPVLRLCWATGAHTLASLPEHSRPHQCQLALQALLSQMEAAPGPGLLLVDDLQHAPQPALDMLAAWLRRAHQPWLVLLASRRPAAAPLAGLLAQQWQVPPLSAPTLGLLLDGVGLQDVQAREAVIKRSDGVPGFALALARQYLAGGDPATQARVPAPLWDLLAARLDQAGHAARHVARCAAAMAPVFEVASLRAWMVQLHQATADQTGADHLPALLDALCACGVLEAVTATSDAPQGAARTRAYRFKYTLLREAARSLWPDAEHRAALAPAGTSVKPALRRAPSFG